MAKNTARAMAAMIGQVLSRGDLLLLFQLRGVAAFRGSRPRGWSMKSKSKSPRLRTCPIIAAIALAVFLAMGFLQSVQAQGSQGVIITVGPAGGPVAFFNADGTPATTG